MRPDKRGHERGDERGDERGHERDRVRGLRNGRGGYRLALAAGVLGALTAVACGGGGSSLDSLNRSAPAQAPAPQPPDGTAPDNAGPGVTAPDDGEPVGIDVAEPEPGAGVSVRMARANWDTGYMQAAIFRALLMELGYEVSDPAEAELTPEEFYPLLARGDYDFWANGWFPTHDVLLGGENLEMGLPEGTVVQDFVSSVGVQIPEGVRQGFLVDKKTADELGIASMADVAANPEPWDIDGDGLADIAGCNKTWKCHEDIHDLIELNGWHDVIEETTGEYEELWAAQIERLERGEAVLAYTWTPSSYITQLVPGQNAYWLAVPRAMFGQNLPANVPESQCPTQPCVMGFTPADISVVANNVFLAANPAAARLFESLTMEVIDVALQNIRYRGGENTEADIASHAAIWIADNRDAVDVWLAEARAAAG